MWLTRVCRSEDVRQAVPLLSLSFGLRFLCSASIEGSAGPIESWVVVAVPVVVAAVVGLVAAAVPVAAVAALDLFDPDFGLGFVPVPVF